MAADGGKKRTLGTGALDAARSAREAVSSGREGFEDLAARGAKAAWQAIPLPYRIGIYAAVGGFLLLMLAVGGAYVAQPSQAACQPAAAVEVTGTVKGVPKQYVRFYVGSSERYKLGQRGPAILAAIHKVETNFGELNGVTSSAGAQGHMQFMPATWDGYGVDANGDGKKDPYDPEDAIYAAGNYLHASGAPEDWRGAIFAYNHATWYVEEVLRYAAQFGDIGDVGDATTPKCENPQETGPAELQKSVRLYQPRSYKMLPGSAMAAGRAPQPVDERIWPAAVWAIRNYDMAVTAAREAGHASHGDGTSLDLVPAKGTSLSDWRNSTERFARDIGWEASCGSSCSPPVIDAPRWVRWIGYNGDPAHGDPAHCSGGCAAHLHVSWNNDDGSEGALVPPDLWVETFPAPGGATK